MLGWPLVKIQATAAAIDARRHAMTPTQYDYVFDAGAQSWNVVDTVSGRVAHLNGVPQEGLALNEADDMSALLNRIQAFQPGSSRGQRPGS